MERTYDIDLFTSSANWSGTFATMVHDVAGEILLDGPFLVQITTENGTVAGTLVRHDAQTLTLALVLAGTATERAIDIHDIFRFRA